MQVEMFDFEVGKWHSFGKVPSRFFGSSLVLPWAPWMAGCELEPNLGIHDYYQDKTREKLKGKQWLCFGEDLVISDEDSKRNEEETEKGKPRNEWYNFQREKKKELICKSFHFVVFT